MRRCGSTSQGGKLERGDQKPGKWNLLRRCKDLSMWNGINNRWNKTLSENWPLWLAVWRPLMVLTLVWNSGWNSGKSFIGIGSRENKKRDVSDSMDNFFG